MVMMGIYVFPVDKWNLQRNITEANEKLHKVTKKLSSLSTLLFPILKLPEIMQKWVLLALWFCFALSGTRQSNSMHLQAMFMPKWKHIQE